MLLAPFLITGAGIAGNYISIDTPYTLTNAEAIGGSWSFYDDSADTVYAGTVAPISTTRVACVQAGATGTLTTEAFGIDPAVTVANGDILRVELTGWYA